MLIKKIAIGVATAALGVSGVALAGALDNGSAYAQPAPVDATKGNGFYVRGQVGYGFVDGKGAEHATFNNQAIKFGPRDKKNDGVTGRVAVGYDFNKYLGLEAGFGMFSSYNREFTATGVGLPGQKVLGNAETKTSLYAADLLAKATLPIDNFYAFVEGGAAYVHAHYNALNVPFVNKSVHPVITGVSNEWKSGSNGSIRPKAGVGVGYKISDNVGVDVSYDRIFATGNNSKTITDKAYVPNINTVMLGLTYKF